MSKDLRLMRSTQNTNATLRHGPISSYVRCTIGRGFTLTGARQRKSREVVRDGTVTGSTRSARRLMTR
jgi:hypothetical protein